MRFAKVGRMTTAVVLRLCFTMMILVSDIKTLDVGKRNLVQTITTVKRFQMLLSGADQLDQMLTHTQYRPASSLLQVSSTVMSHVER